ncbi:MAG: DUF4924 family protein [Bacteroidales bacterium]|nr:DUF4924 family protein [Bacteroidales bacterium]
MIIAQQKRKESIVEYLLYMWQVEDLIRANALDMHRIEETIISKYGIEDAEKRKEVCDWWDNLTEMMRLEKKEQSGHLQITKALMDDVYNFHLYLLTQNTEIGYQNAFQNAWADLSVLINKIPDGDKRHHVDLALTAIYDYFLLKLQGKVVLADTTNAVMRISHFMALLSSKYLKAEKELNKELKMNEDGTLTETN